MNIFDYALKMEKEGEALYRELAEKAPNEGMRNILSLLADDEVKHHNTFKKMKAAEKPGMAETEILKNSVTIFEKMKASGASFDFTGEQKELYRKAREIEKKTRDFYKQKAAEVDDADQKRILLQIADEERRHYHLMDNFEELLLRPEQWVEDGMFYHIEEY